VIPERLDLGVPSPSAVGAAALPGAAGFVAVVGGRTVRSRFATAGASPESLRASALSGRLCAEPSRAPPWRSDVSRSQPTTSAVKPINAAQRREIRLSIAVSCFPEVCGSAARLVPERDRRSA
jgi:hypothetical protein